jgi:PPOX class probable F420-dependent enzyme
MLDDTITTWAQGKNFAVLTTLGDEGAPMAQPMWVDADDTHVLINTEVHRKKFRNIQEDPRVAVTIMDMANPYDYLEVRGEVVDTVTGPAALDHINQLAGKYLGRAEYPGQIQSERVILKIRADRHIGR